MDSASAKAPKKVETRGEMTEWKRRYAEPVQMETYIRGLLSNERNVQLLRCQQRVIPMLTKLVLLKDSPEQFMKEHGKLQVGVAI
jgi:hypothetical protein